MKSTSKRPPMDICEECNEFRQVHQRYDPDTGEEHVLCKNCYQQLHPPNRSKDFCVKCGEFREIVGRGLCQKCYSSVHYHGKLEKYPKQS